MCCFSFFEGYSYLCLFLIPEQLGERTYNPAVIWLVFLESIFKLNFQSPPTSFKAQEVLSVFISPKVQVLDFEQDFYFHWKHILAYLFLGVWGFFGGRGQLLPLLKWVIFSVMTQESSALERKLSSKAYQAKHPQVRNGCLFWINHTFKYFFFPLGLSWNEIIFL